MKRALFVTTLAVLLVFSELGLGATARPAVAQGPGTTVVSAVFSIYIIQPSEATVNIRRITAPWVEDAVTWDSFGNSFVPITPTSSFVSDSIGWHSADVTALVQGWHAGTYPNYGLVLDEGDVPFVYTRYNSSEDITPTLRPRLDVTYTLPGGGTGTDSYTIQRSSGTVHDAYVWAFTPTVNYNYNVLYTGDLDGSGVKYALLQFEQLPTAVTMESLIAHAAPATGITLWSLGLLGMLGLVALRVKRRR